MTSSLGRRGEGFTLVELLIVMVMVGILAGIAVPAFRNAVWKARAAEAVSDVHTVTLAYHNYLADGGGILNSGDWGTVPPALEPYLDEGFSFSTEAADYRWTRVEPGASPWGLEMGMLTVRPLANVRNLLLPKLAMVAPTNTSVVTSTQVRFYITP